MSKTSLETIEFQIGKFAIDFLRDYLKFLGSKDTVEDTVRDFVYNEILRLRDQVKALPYFDSQMLEKYDHLIILDSPEQRKEREKLDADC